MLTCSTLRGATITAVVLLLSSWLPAALARQSLATSYAALFLAALAVLLFAGTFVRSILPGAARRLDECEH